MESIYLKTLIEIARTGSLTKAAETLCVTQSAVSRRVKYLETQYDCPLIDRNGPVLVLTAAGELVRSKAEKILQLEEELKHELCLPDGNDDISFVCTPTFGIVHLPQVMRKFMLTFAENNNLKFIFKMPGEIVSGLKSGCYDIAVIEHCHCLDLGDLKTITLASDKMVFAASPRLDLGEDVQLVDKILEQPLYSRAEGCCSRTLLEANLQKLDRSTEMFTRIIIYDDLQIIIRALIDGLGIAFISDELVAPYVKSGQLKTFSVAGFAHQRRRTLVTSGEYPAKSPSSLFIKTLLEECTPAEGTCGLN